jgi:hypothetical protein
MGLEAVYGGLDLALTRDYTALTLAEVWRRPRADAPLPPPPSRAEDVEQETVYKVQYLDRLPHGLTWKEQAAFIAKILKAVRAKLIAERAGGFGGEPRIPPRTLFIDATGLGSPRMEVIREALNGTPEARDVDTFPVVFLHGQREYNWETHTVGKTFLFRRLTALMATGRLELPARHPMAPVLLDEINRFRFTIDRDGHETLSGEATAHDDILVSLALATMEDMTWVGRSIPFHAFGWQS